MSSTTDAGAPWLATFLWFLTNLLGVLTLGFGYMLYRDPDFYTSRDTAPVECGILKTSIGTRIDPVSVLFFRGEGAFKVSIALFAVVVNKMVVAHGVATWEQASRFCGAMFVAILTPTLLFSHLNTLEEVTTDGENMTAYFDPATYVEGMSGTAVFCSILPVLWLLTVSNSSNNSTAKKYDSSWPVTISNVFAFLGVVFGLLLMYDPETFFGPSGPQPFLGATTAWTPLGKKDKGDPTYEFDPVMLYAARMFGAVHMSILVAFLYRNQYPALVYSFLVTNVLVILPFDIYYAFLDDTTNSRGDTVVNHEQFKLFVLVHSIGLVIHSMACKSTLCATVASQKTTTKKAQ